MDTFDQLMTKMTQQQQAAPATVGDLMRVMQKVLDAHKALKQRIKRIESKGIKGRSK